MSYGAYPPVTTFICDTYLGCFVIFVIDGRLEDLSVGIVVAPSAVVTDSPQGYLFLNADKFYLSGLAILTLLAVFDKFV